MGKTFGIALIVVAMVGGSAAAETESNPWKPVFFASLALSVGTGVFWSLSYASMRAEADQIEASKPDGGPITQDDCNDRADISGDVDGHFDSACAWRSRSRTALAFNVGFGIVTMATIYLAFIDEDEAPPRSNITVTPTISREGAGATLVLRW